MYISTLPASYFQTSGNYGFTSKKLSSWGGTYEDLGGSNYNVEVVIVALQGRKFNVTDATYNVISTEVWSGRNVIERQFTPTYTENNTKATFLIENFNSNTSNQLHFKNFKDAASGLELTKNLIHCTTETNNIVIGVNNILVTANSGYNINNYIPTLKIYNVDTLLETLNFSISSDNKTASLSFNTNDYTGVTRCKLRATALSDYIDFYKHLTNCTCENDNLSRNSVINFVVNSEGIYKFVNYIPQLLVYDNAVLTETINFTLSSNKKQATLIFDSGNYTNITSLELNAVAELPSISITNNIENTTLNYNFDEENEQLIVSVTGAVGRKSFYNAKFTYYDDEDNEHEVDFTINNNVASCTIQNVNYDLIGVCNGSYEYYLDDEIETNLSNCTLIYTPTHIVENSIVTFTLTANQNYIFEIEPTLKLYFLSALAETIDFEVISETSAVITVDFSDYEEFEEITGVEINGLAVLNTDYIADYGNINVYKVTNTQLNNFLKQRFELFENTDLTNYVPSIHKIYFNCGQSESNNIFVLDTDTAITAVTPLFDKQTIDFGSVTIPYYNNDFTDYENAEIQVFLPFVGLINLDNKYFNKTIQLQYIASVVTCNAIAKLICDDITISTHECTLGYELMYKALEYNKEIYGGLSKNTYCNEFEPYVLITYYNTCNNNNVNADNNRAIIGSFSGYNEFIEVEQINVSSMYLELIKDALKEGVYILPIT